MQFKIDENIPEWQHPLLKEEAVNALAIYQEGKTKKKPLYKLECAIGSLNRDVMAQWIVAKWHISLPDFMEIRLY